MITVIIPAFNEEKTISKTLQSLVKQNYTKKFEVLVVNNNSTDNTSREARKFSKSLNLKIINEKRKGRGNARATGADKAKGDIFAYIDADTQASENWLSVIEQEFGKKADPGSGSGMTGPRVAAITGPWELTEIKGWAKWFMETYQEWTQFWYRMFRKHFWLNGMNMVISRAAYEKTKGFDRRLNAHEDIKITEELREFGKIVYCKDLVVKTSGRRYKNGLVKGLLEYQKLWIEHFVFGKKNIDLKDVR